MTDRATFEAHFGLTQRQQQRRRDDGYRDPITQARWEGWGAAQPPEDYKLVPIFATREICRAIEAKVENMITASGMCCEMHRLDGDYIWDAAIAAAK